VQLWHFLE